MKKVAKYIEIYFDLSYLIIATFIGVLFFIRNQYIFSLMTFVLVFGDSFHLVPRICMLIEYLYRNISDKENEEVLYKKYHFFLILGKQVSSISMTIFYVVLYLGLSLNTNIYLNISFYTLALVRIVFCLLKNNRWYAEIPSYKFAIIRNIPFVLMAILLLVILIAKSYILLSIYIFLSFLFYIPVVLFTRINKKIAMLMLPKTLCYIGIISTCLFL